jgi:hypothetical protein
VVTYRCGVSSDGSPRPGPPWRDGPWRDGPWRDGSDRGGSGRDEPWRGGPPWRRGGRPRRARHGSILLALIVFLIEVWGVWAAGRHQVQVRHLDHLGYGLLALGAAALPWRRRAR